MPKDRLLFVKEGRAVYISHLDLMRTFQRAFLRADIPIKHTEGFNPHPFISIALPLSLGFSSECEILEFGLLPQTSYDQVPQRLNAALPEGVRVLECYAGERPIKELAWLEWRIEGEFSGDIQALQESWTGCLSRESWVVEKKSKKAKSGVTTLDIIPLVREFDFTDIEDGRFVIQAVLSGQNPGLNPSVLVNALTEETPQFQPQQLRFRRMAALDGNGEIFR